MHKSNDFVPALIWVPRDVRTWLESQAKHNVSSMQAQVVRAVRDRMHALRKRDQQEVR
ncbi:hypothetical protein H8B02_18495 [Bradyrhizobium sp. Pear77]|uniref:hypothetical protein n=1 Tax=Bradyrhizobium altum TaxID=1571202 RepID=UPI001E3BC788|nr:hypothetical protein [Bradyrhizobium altum]MCC8955351.1 hypothetical protein [Bradyrhizobium altum]